MNDYKMHYIYKGKYDLIFTVVATTEGFAKFKAESELKEDGFDMSRLHLIEIS